MESFTEESWMVASGGTRAPTGLAIRFEQVPVKNDALSDKAGSPVFEDVEYIEKRVPGDRLNIIFRRLTDDDRKQFREQYKAWKTGLEDPKSGMPLKQWAPMTRAEVETFAYHGVRTVEDLAGMSDAGCKGIGAGVMKRRDMALDWLKQANGNAPAIQLRSELEKRDNLIETMQRQMGEQSRMISELSASRGPRPYPVEERAVPATIFSAPEPEPEPVKPKKRGRPAKAAASNP